MKTIILILTSLALLCSCRARVGQFTVISTRNFERKVEYAELKRAAESKPRKTIDKAVEQAVASVPRGEFMKNVIVYQKRNGKFIVVGDIWGEEAKQ